MSLKSTNLTLRDIDLGSLDAESDKGLATYFVTTPYVRTVLDLRAAHVLGRKGSGKSSLFTQLPKLLEAAGKQLRVLQLSPDHYAWAALKEYKEQGLSAEHAHANAWKFTLAIEAAALLASIPPDSLKGEALAAHKTLSAFLSENYGKKPPGLTATATRLVKGLKAFNLSAFGFGVGFQKDVADQPMTPAVIDALLEAIRPITDSLGIVIALDRLDDSWDGSEDAKHLLIGLLKAAKELNDRLSRPKEALGLSVIVLLRSDIYEGLRFDDKDKHRGTEVHIEWNPDLLKQMVDARLPSGVSVDELLEQGEMRGSIEPFNYIVKRTFLRPREVIQFLLECRRRAGLDAVVITKDQIRAAEERYSLWKVEDVKQEYHKLYPHFEHCVEALRQGHNRYESINEFEQYLAQKLGDSVKDVGLRRVMEYLFDASVIGVRLADAGNARFKCEDSDLALPAKGAVYVHQSLHRGLNIRERRAEG